MTYFLTIAIVTLLCVAGVFDLAARRVPNTVVLCLLAATILYGLALGAAFDWAKALLITALVFGGTLLMFWRGWLGGGDAKLLTAVSFGIPPAALAEFFLIMAVLGLGLGGVILLQRIVERQMGFVLTFLGPFGRGSAALPPNAREAVPYGVAIAAAAIWVFLRHSNG